MEENNIIGNGVLLGKGEHDWIAGANSPIEKTITLETGDWKPKMSRQEIQFLSQYLYDTLFCVTYSSLKSIAGIMNLMKDLGMIPVGDLAWYQEQGYLDEDGRFNFNERFIGTLGETTTSGAYQYKVANAIKNYGLIPQKMFPMADNFADNIDKKFITEKMYKMGEEWKKRVYANWHWVNAESLKEEIKHSPIQMIVKFANYEKPDDILKPEGELNHAVAGVFTVTSYNEISDTYWQEYKKYDPSYTHSFMAFNITLLNTNNMNSEKFIKDNDLKWVQNSNNGQFGRVMRGKLMTVKSDDRATLMLLDDKMRTEPSIKINQAEWDQLERDGFVANF